MKINFESGLSLIEILVSALISVFLILGVIQVFNRYGNFKGVVGDDKGEVMRWKTPVGIAVDDRGRLYVVDMVANQVKVYDLTGKKINKT